MFVTKRNGRKESVSFDKVSARVKKMCYGLEDTVDLYTLSQQVILGLYDGVTTVEIDNLIAESAAAKSTQHYNYSVLASRIAISSLHKTTEKSYLKVVKLLYNNLDEETGEKAPLVTKQFYEFVRDNVDIIESIPIYDRDFDYDYFGFKTLQRGYLLKVNKKIVERPQHMLLRVAIGIHMDNIEKIKETYELLSQRWFTHATPTLFNAGTPRPQLSSCFLMTVDDSISGMYKTLSDCAQISKYAGGIGIDISKIRGEGAYIKGTGGHSNGIVPMLKVFNEAARHVDQGGGRRKGSFAIYLEPWHSEIFEFLDLKKNHGKEEQRARDLFYALWVSDLFMKRVENNEDWTLFSPNKVPLLTNTYGEDFEKAYIEYEQQGLGFKVVKAQTLWTKIIETQREVGIPYLLFKDAANSKSNQQNLGTIKSSNLCCEILEYTSEDEIAVCNLASISLPKFFINGEVDYKKLYEVTRVITRNLDTVIDINYYPVIEAQNSNFKHRPIGIGVQGLADLFILLRLPFTSDKAKQVNKDIFETIYYAAISESIQLAKEKGQYSTFEDSPISRGLFQFDLWNVTPSDRYNWDELREEIKLYGIRNSLLLAPMPTASTSQILGNNEAFEPYTTNIYSRRTLSGEFVIVNKHLIKDLISLNLWNEEIREAIIHYEGSIQNIDIIPQEIKELYKTAWEMSMKDIIDMSAVRGAFICQSQSLNLFVENLTNNKISSMHFYSWKKGLKTGMYYLRSRPAVNPIKFTLSEKYQKKFVKEESTGSFCTMEDGCIMCSG